MYSCTLAYSLLLLGHMYVGVGRYPDDRGPKDEVGILVFLNSSTSTLKILPILYWRAELTHPSTV